MFSIFPCRLVRVNNKISLRSLYPLDQLLQSQVPTTLVSYSHQNGKCHQVGQICMEIVIALSRITSSNPKCFLAEQILLMSSSYPIHGLYPQLITQVDQITKARTVSKFLIQCQVMPQMVQVQSILKFRNGILKLNHPTR